MKYRLSGGQLITADGIEEKDLLISNGTIEGIIARKSACSSDYRVLDCAGNFISAGFVDIHQHGGGGSDYMDGFPEDYVNATGRIWSTARPLSCRPCFRQAPRPL